MATGVEGRGPDDWKEQDSAKHDERDISMEPYNGGMVHDILETINGTWANQLGMNRTGEIAIIAGGNSVEGYELHLHLYYGDEDTNDENIEKSIAEMREHALTIAEKLHTAGVKCTVNF